MSPAARAKENKKLTGKTETSRAEPTYHWRVDLKNRWNVMTPKRPKKRRPFAREENPHKIFRKMIADHVDVLQNIEFILVDACRENEAIDDRIVASTLKATKAGQCPTGELTRMLFDRLAAMRQKRNDVSGENPGSKLDKAKELDIPVLSEEQFISLIG